jgi:hypothetical protein
MYIVIGKAQIKLLPILLWIGFVVLGFPAAAANDSSGIFVTKNDFLTHAIKFGSTDRIKEKSGLLWSDPGFEAEGIIRIGSRKSNSLYLYQIPKKISGYDALSGAPIFICDGSAAFIASSFIESGSTFWNGYRPTYRNIYKRAYLLIFWK